MSTRPEDPPGDSPSDTKKLSAVLRDLKESPGESVSLNLLITSLGNRSFVPLLIIFAIPNLFFFVPGSSVITGLPLIFMAAQLVLGRPAVWLPNFLGNRAIEHQAFVRIITRTIPWIEWVERLVKPRYWLLPPRASELTVGLGCLVMSVVMFLPIPFGNTLPALSVILLALSLSERDGLWLLGGFLLSLVSFAVVGGLIAGGAFAVTLFF